MTKRSCPAFAQLLLQRLRPIRSSSAKGKRTREDHPYRASKRFARQGNYISRERHDEGAKPCPRDSQTIAFRETVAITPERDDQVTPPQQPAADACRGDGQAVASPDALTNTFERDGQVAPSPDFAANNPAHKGHNIQDLRIDSRGLYITLEEATELIRHLHPQLSDAPTAVHAEIVQSIRQGAQCSDSIPWRDIIQRSNSRNQKNTLLTCLEYIGVYKHHAQLTRRTMKTLVTKNGQPVSHQFASGKALDQITGLDSEDQTDWSSPARVRGYINTSVGRGKRLLNEFVENLGLGILLSPKIWNLIGYRAEDVPGIVQGIRADDVQMKLFEVLTEQVEYMTRHGTTNPHEFYKSLERLGLVTKDDLEKLFLTHEIAEISATELQNANSCLLESLGTKVIGRPTWNARDRVNVGGSLEVPCGSLLLFGEEQGPDAWAIAAVMQTSDKFDFVRFHRSITVRSNGESQNARASGILEAVIRGRETTNEPLVHFCPLQHGRSCFTLLEVNEKEREIRHYDSHSETNAHRLTDVSTFVQEAFGDLGFSYNEIPTPQQDDEWSCGARVVWNFRHLAKGLPMGPSSRKVHPRRICLEIVTALETSITENVIGPALLVDTPGKGDALETPFQTPEPSNSRSEHDQTDDNQGQSPAEPDDLVNLGAASTSLSQPPHARNTLIYEVFQDESGNPTGFQFEDAILLSEHIQTVTDGGWLEAGHIGLFSAYLRANLSARGSPWKIHFFGPLSDKDIKAGWDCILGKEGPQRAHSIKSSQYLAFPVNHREDHWLTIVLASSSTEGFSTGTPAVYILDPLFTDWDHVDKDLFPAIRRVVAALGNGDSLSAEFYSVPPGVIPQQTKELCGYYVMLYFELLAKAPERLLSVIRRGVERFEPGSLDQAVWERYRDLVEEFQHAKLRNGVLLSPFGRPVIDGGLSRLTHDLNIE